MVSSIFQHVFNLEMANVIKMVKDGAWNMKGIFIKAIGVLLMSFTLLSCALTTTGVEMKKFEWLATEGAPRNYPIKIVSGDLRYHNKSGSQYVPHGVRLQNGWGEGRSTHVGSDDLKPLPDHLDITYFSYTEDLFYEGSFELPYEEILSLFQKGFYSPNEEGNITYSYIVVGVAPGGSVAVWLWGLERKTQVFFGQANKIDGDWRWINKNPNITRAEYVRLGIEESLRLSGVPELLKEQEVPIGRWSGYQVRYHWQPEFTGMTLRHGRVNLINYFNGEQDYLNYPLELDVVDDTRAVPSRINFTFEDKGGYGRTLELDFDESEIFAAYQKLGNKHQPLKLEFLLEPAGNNLNFTVLLKNMDGAIELTRSKLQSFNAGRILPDGSVQY